mgnify:CR=1 FL=1
MAILASRVIVDFPQFYKIDSVKSFTYNKITQPNRNRLLWLDPTVDGILVPLGLVGGLALGGLELEFGGLRFFVHLGPGWRVKKSRHRGYNVTLSAFADINRRPPGCAAGREGVSLSFLSERMSDRSGG